MSETKTSAYNGGGGWGCLGCFVGLFLSLKTWGWTWWALLHFVTGWRT